MFMRKYIYLGGIALILSSFTACVQPEELKDPKACFNVSKNTVDVNETVSFYNCSTDAKNYGWNFGDNQTSIETEPTHSYAEPGTKTIRLRAYNGDKIDETTLSITVVNSNPNPDPVACFTMSSNNVSKNQQVTFTNCSTNAISYAWDFGDGQTSTEVNPTHSYTNGGTYSVILKASSSTSSDQILKSITVSDVQSGYANVEFYINMNAQIGNGNFTSSSDFVDLAGTFNNWGSPAGIVMDDSNGDGIYYVMVPNQQVGTVLEFKFRINGDWNTAEFPFGVNRIYTVVDGSNILNLWYNDIPVSGIDPYNYYGVPGNMYENYLIDDFSTNDLSWYEVNDGTFKATVQNGVYELANNSTDQSWFVWSAYYGPDEARNFEIEISALIPTSLSADDYGAGLFWGKSETDWQYDYFMFSPLGYYTCGIYNNGTYNAWIDWQQSLINVTPGTNVLTVRKIAGNYYFYVNQTYVGERPAPALFGNLFGFSTGPQETFQIDYVNIKYINLGSSKSSTNSLRKAISAGEGKIPAVR